MPVFFATTPILGESGKAFSRVRKSNLDLRCRRTRCRRGPRVRSAFGLPLSLEVVFKPRWLRPTDSQEHGVFIVICYGWLVQSGGASFGVDNSQVRRRATYAHGPVLYVGQVSASRGRCAASVKAAAVVVSQADELPSAEIVAENDPRPILPQSSGRGGHEEYLSLFVPGYGLPFANAGQTCKAPALSAFLLDVGFFAFIRPDRQLRKIYRPVAPIVSNDKSA